MPENGYKPKGKYKRLTEADKRNVYVRSDPDSEIVRQVDCLSDYLRDFGIVSAKELMLMLVAWLCDPDNEVESRKYWDQLKGNK